MLVFLPRPATARPPCSSRSKAGMRRCLWQAVLICRRALAHTAQRFPVTGFHVSIHAPRRGQRRHVVGIYHLFHVSIRAPAWGATNMLSALSSRACFNSRPRVGGDVQLSKIMDDVSVSIRAPAWGATWVFTGAQGTGKFQFAPPRGGRPSRSLPVRYYRLCFNSRPRVGGDKVSRLS